MTSQVYFFLFFSFLLAISELTADVELLNFWLATLYILELAINKQCA